jgi:hypothetical protein
MHGFMMKRYHTFILGCIMAAGTSLAQSPDPDPLGPVVELPTFEVREDRVLPPLQKWKYVQLPDGYEVLSDCGRWMTSDFVKEFHLLRQVAEVVLPASKKTSALPTYIILSGEGNLYSRFIPNEKMDRTLSAGSPSMMVSDGERLGIVVRIDSGGVRMDSDDFSNSSSYLSGDELVSVSSDMEGDNDYVVKEDGTLARRGEALSFSSFHRQYFRDLLRRSVHPLQMPLWAEEGMSKIFEGVRFNRKTIDIGAISSPGFNMTRGNSILWPAKYGYHRLVAQLYTTWIPGVTRFDPEKRLPTKRHRILQRTVDAGAYSPSDYEAAKVPFIPLDKFFAVKDVENEVPMFARIYSSQAYLFAHICLHSIEPYHKGFREKYAGLVKLATSKLITEQDFIACFGFGYDKMLSYMSDYAESANFNRYTFDAKRGLKLQPAPEFEVRTATDAESGRISGEVLRMAGQSEVALERLIAPYLRGDRTPDLLAALGIAEAAAGKAERARKFLEKAVQEKTTRARAYAELARLRLDEILAKALAEKRKLTPAEVETVVSVATAGLERPPVMPEFYDHLAKVWTQSSSAPDARQFGAMLSGVKRYPANFNLVFSVAQIGLLHGYLQEARLLIDHGLEGAPSPEIRAPFERLAKRLEAKHSAAPAATPAAP